MMHLFLRFYSGFLAALLLFGGTYLRTRLGKIEIGSLEPFFLLFLILLAITRKLFPSDWNRFHQDLCALLNAAKDATRSRRRLIAWLFIIFGAAFLAHVARHYSYDTHLFDMGFLHQAVFYPFSDGTILQADLSPKRSYLVDHFSPALLLLAPVSSWLHSHIVIYLLQCVILALGTYFLISSGPIKANRSLWFIAGILVLANRSLRNGAIWDFREDVLAFSFLCGALVFLSEKRWLLYLLSLSAYLLSKEHLGMVALGLIVPILLDRDLGFSRTERRRLALTTAALVLIWTACLFGLITPKLHEGLTDASNISLRLPRYGTTPGTIILHLLTHPLALAELILDKVTNFPAIKYIVLLLAPGLFFSWRAWPWLFAAAFGISMNLIFGNRFQISMNYHYDLAFLPFLLWAALLGLRKASTLQVRGVPALIVGIALAIGFSGRWPMFHVFSNFPSSQAIADIRYIEKLPCTPSESLAASPLVLGLASHCPEIRSLGFPEKCDDPWRLFQSMTRDTSRLEGQSALNARLILLDRNQPCQSHFEKALLSRNALTRSESPSKRWVLVERSLP